MVRNTGFDRRFARRRRVVALLALSTIGASLGVAPSVAAGEVTANGTGRVIAVAPVSGGLSLEVGMGSAIADLKGTTPRAESATLKPGIVGLLAGSTVPLPSPSKADLRGETNVDRSSLAPPIDAGALRLTATRERASVTSDQDEAGFGAAARTDLSDLEVAGTLEISGGTADASANAKQAVGHAAMGRVTIGVAGTTLVDLQDLEWRVVSKLGDKPVVSFSVGSANIQGDRQAIDSPAELATALEPLKPLLAPAGISIRVPTAAEVAGGASLSPLVIESINAGALRSSVGALYPQIAPAYNELATQLQGQVPEAGLALLVANVGLSVAAGNGGVRLSLGGVSATIAPRATFGAADFDSDVQRDVSTTPSLTSGVTPMADAAPSFFSDVAAERVEPVISTRSPATAAPTTPITPVSGGPTPPRPARTAGATGAGTTLAMAPLAASGDSTVPATLVMAAVLAVVSALAARDQMTVRRRDALRQARARSVSI